MEGKNLPVKVYSRIPTSLILACWAIAAAIVGASWQSRDQTASVHRDLQNIVAVREAVLETKNEIERLRVSLSKAATLRSTGSEFPRIVGVDTTLSTMTPNGSPRFVYSSKSGIKESVPPLEVAILRLVHAAEAWAKTGPERSASASLVTTTTRTRKGGSR